MKLTLWKKGLIEWAEGNTAFISVAFSWDAEQAYQCAVWYGSLGYEVRVGGHGSLASEFLAQSKLKSSEIQRSCYTAFSSCVRQRQGPL